MVVSQSDDGVQFSTPPSAWNRPDSFIAPAAGSSSSCAPDATEGIGIVTQGAGSRPVGILFVLRADGTSRVRRGVEITRTVSGDTGKE